MSANVLTFKRPPKSKPATFVKSVMEKLELGHHEISQFMGIDQDFLSDALKDKKKFPVESILNLANSLNFSLESMSNGQLDLNAVAKHYHGKRDYLPHKYTFGAFSKKSMIANILDYLTEVYSPQLASSVMFYFQLNETIFDNPEIDKVNYVLFEDIIKFLKSKGLTDYDVWAIGNNMPAFSMGSSFAKKMSSFKSLKELWEVYLVELIDSVEQNNEYELASLSENVAVLRSYERESALDTFKVNSIGDESRCIYRAGALAYTPTYLGLPPAAVKETKCIHNGDKYCEFQINFSNSRMMLN